jgi:hypothetical protein
MCAFVNFYEIMGDRLSMGFTSKSVRTFRARSGREAA